MNVEELRKELEQTEKDLQRYIRAREKLQERIISLEARKKRILEELGSEQGGGPGVEKTAEVRSETVTTLPVAKSGTNTGSHFSRVRVARPVNILAAMEHTKGILEGLEQNIGKTFQTMDEIMSLLATINDYSGQFRSMVRNLSSMGKKAKDSKESSSASGLAELAKLPIVRNLAKELLTSVVKA